MPDGRASRAFFPTRGKEPKGARWQPNRASTMAAPGPLAAWAGGGTSCHARLFASSRGRLGAALGVMPVVRWRPGGTGGPPSLRARWWALWLRLQARGSFAHRLMCGAVLSHSRERTKGRPVAAKPRQHHGCPGPLAAWLVSETSCCVRLIASSRGRLGAALGVMPVVRWRPGGTGGPPSLRAGWWACRARRGVSVGVEEQVRNGAVLRNDAWPEEQE